MTTPDEIVKYARTWIGTRWKHQGRCETGIDCAGLLIKTAQHFDLPYEDLTGYGRQPDAQFLRQIRKYTLPVRPRTPVNGAIGVFNDSAMPCHTGIFAIDEVSGQVTVIHAESWPKRRVHEQLYEGSLISLRDKLVDIRLFKEVDYVQ
jgi:hypothetical protein